MKYIFDELRYMTNKKITIYVIFSPASASYDQFKNFEERGNQFKKLIIYSKNISENIIAKNFIFKKILREI